MDKIMIKIYSILSLRIMEQLKSLKNWKFALQIILKNIIVIKTDWQFSSIADCWQRIELTSWHPARNTFTLNVKGLHS